MYNNFNTVRLVDGKSYNEGRVEVYFNGEWGTVCDNEWSENKATMVCVDLGLGSSGIPENFGPGSGRVLLDNIICSKNDKTLTNCGHYGVGVAPFCSHSEDVGVKCFGMTKLVHTVLHQSYTYCLYQDRKNLLCKHQALLWWHYNQLHKKCGSNLYF